MVGDLANERPDRAATAGPVVMAIRRGRAARASARSTSTFAAARWSGSPGSKARASRPSLKCSAASLPAGGRIAVDEQPRPLPPSRRRHRRRRRLHAAGPEEGRAVARTLAAVERLGGGGLPHVAVRLARARRHAAGELAASRRSRRARGRPSAAGHALLRRQPAARHAGPLHRDRAEGSPPQRFHPRRRRQGEGGDPSDWFAPWRGPGWRSA